MIIDKASPSGERRRSEDLLGDQLGSELQELAKRLSVSELAEMERFPKYFEIETTNLCQARCEMCTINDWVREKRLMEDTLFDKIVEEMKPHADWIEKVALFRDGEPLLDKKIAQRVSKMKAAGIKKVGFSTNAGLLNEKRAVALLDARIDEIMFSIDGATKETFEKIRKGLVFEEVRDNVLRFIRLRDEREASTRVCIRMVLQDDNRHEHQDWISYWLPKVRETDSVYAKGYHTWGNQLDPQGAPVDFSNYVQPCISPYSTMVVHSDGKVGLCGVDYNAKMLMGNLHKNSLKEIWTSAIFRDVRERHSCGRRNDIRFCVGCKIWDLSNKFIATV